MKWPMAPLLALARTRNGERMAVTEMAVVTGIARTNLAAWQSRGIPSDEKAERLAVALGFDPANVWGDEWTQAQIAAVSAVCPECHEVFVPVRKGHMFCSRECRQSAWLKRPGNAARKAANRRARYLANLEEETAYKRNYYATYREYECARQRRYDRARRAALRQEAS